jgi:CubicO group peptidase (beta-lactamase class C family)
MMGELSLEDRCRQLSPSIARILAISGSPGLSIGVLHHGVVAYTAHFGQKNVSKPSTPDDDTVYRIASLTKALTVTTVASLVEDDMVSWNTPIREILPEFQTRGDEIGEKATLIDLLSNRTGLSQANALFSQQYAEILLPKSEVIRMSCMIQAVSPFRKSFVYSSWNYGLAQEVIETITGKNYGLAIKERILDPLDLRRTTFARLEGENIATPHGVRNDGTACELPFTRVYPETIPLAAGAAGKSTIRDMLLLYKSMLSAYEHQIRTSTTSTPGSPFKQLKTVFTPQIGVGKSHIDDQAYCLGLYRTRLPGKVGVASLNNLYLGPKNSPFIGTKSSGVELFHHTGNLPGNLSSAFLVPSSESAIIVLTNALALTDPTDFVGQLLLSAIIGESPSEEFITLSHVARKASLASYSRLHDKLEKGRTVKPPSHPLEDYEGEYFNAAGNFLLSIISQPDGLLMSVQKMPLTKYKLFPYDGDTFYWPVDREDELCNKCMFLNVSPGGHKITFTAGVDGTVDRLIWGHDAMARPEVFQKESSVPGQERIKL